MTGGDAPIDPYAHCHADTIGHSGTRKLFVGRCAGCRPVKPEPGAMLKIAPESLYVSEIAAANTVGGPSNRPKEEYSFVNWNQYSDRAVPGQQRGYVPRNRTRHRPGGAGPVGRGVDVKHGSYQRYLNRKKGKEVSAKHGIYQQYLNKKLNVPRVKCVCGFATKARSPTMKFSQNSN